jgi:hypothetical protein
MKTNNLMVVLALLCLVFSVRPTKTLSQPLTDSTVNFFTLSAYYDDYYDSLIHLRGIENMQGTDYKDYLRWKWFYTSRHGVNGDLGAIWEGILDYHENFDTPEGYTDESDWKFIGPKGFPLMHNDQPSGGTGKGMILSIWVSGGDHSLIYAGSHHGGLWKTTNGGNSWLPLNDNDPRIHGVNSIAVNPSNPEILYISCGSKIGNLLGYEEGLFKSTDGGLSWDQLILPVNYPVADEKIKQRKVVLHPDNPDKVFFVTYRNVYRSNDQGNNWETVFYKKYFRWDENIPPEHFGPHTGLFDFKVIPWNQDVAYLAGSEIFKIDNPLGSFDTTNISDAVFLAGLNPEDYIKYIPDRTEISIHENFQDKVWFCYVAKYVPITGDSFSKLRVVMYDVTANVYQVAYEENGNTLGNPKMDANKLEFTVSPNYNRAFYFGGVGIARYDPRIVNQYSSIRAGEYPGVCWVHDDIRDMQIFSDGNGNDTLYIADDSGISWGTKFESGQTGCNDDAWHWRHPCDSKEFGLNVTEFYGIGCSEEAPYLVAGGCQDLSVMLRDGDDWINIPCGDGSELIFAPDNPNIIYFSEMQSGSLNRSLNKGETAQNIFYFNFSHEIIPMELDPKDPSVLYSGNKILLKFNGVNDFTLPTPLVPEELHTFSNPITAIKVMKSGYNSKRYFVATTKAYNETTTPSSEFEGCIYYSDDGTEFIDISANLDACRYGFVSGIEVNPENPDQIWVCASLYSTTKQNSKVYTLTLPGTDWQDFSQELPAGLPVIKIKFLSFLNRLYAATDVGIFIRDIGDAQWYPYNTNLPLKLITDIEFNLPYQKIFAATYGRGLWETELEGICDHTAPPLWIDNHEIWSIDNVLHGDIIIQNGGILEIDHCRLYMPENARISVRPGGTLIVDGGTITSSCPSPWGGIEVWGSNQCQSFPEYFGQVYLKNHAVIKNALVAISNYGLEEILQPGGIIFASDATFRNNQIAVNYRKFTNMYLGQEHPYRSSFTRCKFEFNQYSLPGLDFEYFIKMDRVNGIRFRGCDFANSIDLTGSQGEIEDKYGTGIYSLGSQFYVDQTCINPEIYPCTLYKPSTFTGLNYGIYAMGMNPVYTISVNKSIFRDNVNGVFLSGIENATVTSNDFHVNNKYKVPPIPYDTYVGLYLDLCTGFTVEENYFDQENDYIFHNTGIVVKDAGVNNNEIYNNFFTNRFEVGIMALNKNRGRDFDQGLVIKCNEFTVLKFEYDILVIEKGTVTENSGIAQHQGSNASETSPAGNLFSRYSLDDWKDYVNQVDRNHIDYFMHDPSLNIRVRPLHYTVNSITLISTGWQFVRERACYSHLTSPGPGPGILKAQMSLTELKIDSAQTELSTWVDGGNTEEVISEVAFSTPPEAYDLYSDLILKSPYLSDTVLKESIQKEDVLDNIMIEDILVANPQSAKSAEIQETLDGKIYQLTEDQRESVDQGIYIVSAKEILESHVAWQKHCRAMILDDLITLYKNDTVNDWAGDSLISLLNSENNPSLLYQLAFIRLNGGDSAAGMNVLNNMENSFDFNNDQLTIHQQYDDYAGHYSEIVNSDNPELALDSISRSALYALAEQKTFPGVYSRNMLQFYDTLVYIEPYILPSGQVKTGEGPVGHGEKPQVGNEDFRIYPNPAMSYFIAEYAVQTTLVESLELMVSDISGSVLQKIILPGNSGHKIISTKDLNPGLYLCKFVLNGKEKQTIKLSVIK